MNVKFRKAKADEFPELYKLIAMIFPNARFEIKRNDFVFLAESHSEKAGEELIGFAHYSVKEGKVLLRGLGIKNKFRGKGIATSLLDYSLKKLPKDMSVYLKVKSSNDPAIALYVKSGFFQKKYGNVSVMAKLPEN